MKKAMQWMLALNLIAWVFVLAACEGWEMDYGKPAAQFFQKDLCEKGKAYIGKKITVKGIVTRVDTSNPKSAWVHLESGIRCNFGKFTAMAGSYKVGDQVFVDGFLKRCNKDDILIEPAGGRDPSAPFSPK